MSRKKAQPKIVRVELFDSTHPTADGRVYPLELLERIRAAIAEKPVGIEEVSPVERRVKHIPVCYPWPEHDMALSTSSEIVDGKLFADFAVKNNKFGRLLNATIEAGDVEYIPVGIGDVDKDNVVSEYTLQYVAISPKQHEHDKGNNQL